MSQLTSRCYRLRRRPDGTVTADDLEFLTEPVPPLDPGQALIRTLWLSLDPANRIWMSDVHYSLPPVPIGRVMRGIGIGQVVQSRREDMSPGQLVSGLTGWADYAIADTKADDTSFTILPSPPPAPLPALLGPLGHTGFTAYLGVHDIGEPQPGETMVVSAAAGAVGSIAGQIGKARGARVVGIAGSEQKCRYVVDHLGFDACVNYNDADWRERLALATPDGVDVDFENVGGQILGHLLTRLNVGARVVLCGLISEYNTYGSSAPEHPPYDITQILMVKRALVKSFLVLDHTDRFPEATAYLNGLIADNKLRYDETVVEGLEHAREALNQLFDGSNTGKLLVKVADLEVLSN
jgi:NADPH-dependent curcumin reductase CurA